MTKPQFDKMMSEADMTEKWEKDCGQLWTQKCAFDIFERLSME
jgi:hypothetical protein